MKSTVSHRFLLRSAVATAMIALAVSQAMSQTIPPGYPSQVSAHDAREVARLPRYCLFTQYFRESVPGGNDRQQIDYWYSVMGQTFHSMHHYCWGLMKLNRALFLSRDEMTRNFYLTDAVTEFNYVLNHADDEFVLLPEILTKKGQSLLLAGRPGLGIVELERAINLKPDYWPPYAHLSDHYRTSGDIAKARSLLEEALSKSPDVNALKERLAALDAPRKGTTKPANQR